MKEEKKFKVSELVTNRQYRAIIILVFYFFFFVILIIGARTALNKKEVTNDETVKEQITNTTKVNGFSSIKESNFNYKYTLNIDDKIYTYEGKRYDNKDSFTLSVDKDIRNYVQVDNFSFEIKDKEKVLTDKPIYYLDFFDINILEEIIKNSIKKSDNIYSIDNKSLDSILKGQLGVNNKLENSIMLTCEDNTITRIDINYTNYMKFTNRSINKVLLTLEYKDFGKVLDFNVKNNDS